MRIIGLVVVVAIVYLIYGRIGDGQSPHNRIADEQHEAALVQPEPPAAQTVAVSGSLRAPLDRTRQVLQMVKGRNTE